MNAPTFLLVPVSARYRPGEALATLPGDYELHGDPGCPAKQLQLELHALPPLDLFSYDAPVFTSIEPLILRRERWRQEERLTPRARRQRARTGRRRRVGAFAVPMAWRAEVNLFQPEGVPEGLAKRIAEARMLPVMTVWSCPWWRRGAPIFAHALPATNAKKPGRPTP